MNAECRNTEGGRECRCNDGFDGDGRVCGHQQCAVDNGGCHVNAECRNTEGAVSVAVTTASTVMAGSAATSTSVPWITVAAI